MIDYRNVLLPMIPIQDNTEVTVNFEELVVSGFLDSLHGWSINVRDNGELSSDPWGLLDHLQVTDRIIHMLVAANYKRIAALEAKPWSG